MVKKTGMHDISLAYMIFFTITVLVFYTYLAL